MASHPNRFERFTRIRDGNSTIEKDHPFKRPLVDVYQTAEHILIIADVPGFSDGDVKVKMDFNTLVVSGKRALEERSGDKVYQERATSRLLSFHRTFELHASCQVEQITTEVKAGLLLINIPFTQSPKDVNIKG